jgi:hypothetical protein
MKYIDVSKKRKNLKPFKHYDSKNNGYKLIIIDDISDTEIYEWCKDTNLPNYVCINEIHEINIDEFIDNYGEYKPLIPRQINKEDIDINNKQSTLEFLKQIFQRCKNYSIYTPTTENMNRKSGINNYISENKEYNYGRNKHNECIFINYTDENYYHLVGLTDQKTLPKQTNNYIKKTPYIVNGNKVKYSVLKEEYKQQNNTHGYTNEDEDGFIEDNNNFPKKYYWKTPDGWLYLYDKAKPEIISLDIVSPLPVKNNTQPNILTEPAINNDIMLFANQCCKKTDKTNLRFGLKDIYKIYETWCKINGKKCLKQKIFKEEFEKINYKEEKSKGVDINNKPGKRGYNIMISL